MQIVFANIGLHGSLSTRTWYYAHLAVLDGVSTIGRRFVRRSPNTVASFNQMAGSLDALKDEDIATRMASTAPGQRLSFSLSGPSGPAANSAIAGVHIKQIAQGGSDGPTATAGFLRIAGVTHDAPAVSVPMRRSRPKRCSTCRASPPRRGSLSHPIFSGARSSGTHAATFLRPHSAPAELPLVPSP